MDPKVTILDGGMGRELERMGAPFRQPEWSALALMEAPHFVLRAHRAFIEAGAEVIATNSYALVPYHIGAARFTDCAKELAELAGRLAREAATAADHPVRVAGSLPPLFGSYRPELFDAERAPALAAPLVAGLSPHVDLWLAETQSAIAEAQAARLAVPHDDRPFWVSFTLTDADADLADPRLRSGETVAEAVRAATAIKVAAILFNCSHPEVMEGALAVARRTLADLGTGLPLGVYANAFVDSQGDSEANESVSDLRRELTPDRYAEFAESWVARGATLIGGCCGIGPAHIAALTARFAEPTPAVSR